MDDNLALLIRLDASQGYYNMGDLMPIVDYLSKRGVRAIIESPPGAPLDGVQVHYIKVPPELLEISKDCLQDYFSENTQA